MVLRMQSRAGFGQRHGAHIARKVLQWRVEMIPNFRRQCSAHALWGNSASTGIWQPVNAAQRPKCCTRLPAGCGVMHVSHSVHTWRLCICSKSMCSIHGQSGADAHRGYSTSSVIFGRHKVSRSHVHTNFWGTCKSTLCQSRRRSCRCRWSPQCQRVGSTTERSNGIMGVQKAASDSY